MRCIFAYDQTAATIHWFRFALETVCRCAFVICARTRGMNCMRVKCAISRMCRVVTHWLRYDGSGQPPVGKGQTRTSTERYLSSSGAGTAIHAGADRSGNSLRQWGTNPPIRRSELFARVWATNCAPVAGLSALAIWRSQRGLFPSPCCASAGRGGGLEEPARELLPAPPPRDEGRGD